MKQDYLPIEKLISLIGEPNGSACFRILQENRELFETVQGSTNNHQNWPGGYLDHVTEVMNIAAALYPLYTSIRPLPFPLSDALLVLYLHDVEKPWKYELKNGELVHRAGMQTKADHQVFRMRKLGEYGIVLSPEQENGMKYAEGELNDYTNKHRVMNELAAFAHICDVTSARIWYNYPAADPWRGAVRTAVAR